MTWQMWSIRYDYEHQQATFEISQCLRMFFVKQLLRGGKKRNNYKIMHIQVDRWTDRQSCDMHISVQAKRKTDCSVWILCEDHFIESVRKRIPKHFALCCYLLKLRRAAHSRVVLTRLLWWLRLLLQRGSSSWPPLALSRRSGLLGSGCTRSTLLARSPLLLGSSLWLLPNRLGRPLWLGLACWGFLAWASCRSFLLLLGHRLLPLSLRWTSLTPLSWTLTRRRSLALRSTLTWRAWLGGSLVSLSWGTGVTGSRAGRWWLCLCRRLALRLGTLLGWRALLRTTYRRKMKELLTFHTYLLPLDTKQINI